jgi:hypothetical protein
MESKHTRGQIILWRDSTRISTTRNGNILRVIASVNRNKYIEDEEATSNAQLIVDTFNVTNETNMTPRELQKSHAEMLEALTQSINDLRKIGENTLKKGHPLYGLMMGIVYQHEQAIKNATK